MSTRCVLRANYMTCTISYLNVDKHYELKYLDSSLVFISNFMQESIYFVEKYALK